MANDLVPDEGAGPTPENASIHPPTTTVRLVDGTLVTIRPVSSADRDELLAGFERLSERSRYLRFFTQKPRLTESDLRYLTDVDFEDHYALGAFADEDGSIRGVGVARWFRLVDRPSAAEASVVVIDAYQRRGIGSALLQSLLESARDSGIRTIVGDFLAENDAIRELVDAADLHTEWSDDGTVHVELSLDDAGLGSVRDLVRRAAEGALALIPQRRAGRGDHGPDRESGGS